MSPVRKPPTPTPYELDATKPRVHRILIIDDDAAITESMAMLLELDGHMVRWALDGPTGIQLATEFKPGLILCDIGMPGMTGYDVVRALRAQPSGEKTVIAAVTGYGQPEDIRQTKAAGFDYHLVKPVDADAILALVASLTSDGRHATTEQN